MGSKVSAIIGLVMMLALLLGALPAAQGGEPRGEAKEGPAVVSLPGPEARPLPASTGDAHTWKIERVDALHSFSDMGDRSLALDAAGRPHIAYGQDSLYHAWYDGTAWHVETADDTGRVGQFTSLALDVNGWPHISYCVFSVSRPWTGCVALKYAYQDAAGWHAATVDRVDSAGYEVGPGSSLALDGDGYPHISYSDYNELRYASLDATGWHTTTVVTGTGYIPPYSSLALDAAGRPHISYHANADLYYAYQDAAGWHSEWLDYVGRQPYDGNSLTLDGAGYPHIGYNVDGDYLSPGCVKYAYQDAAGWHIEMVDSQDAEGEGYRYISLALDGGGRPHVSYYDDVQGDLKCADRRTAGWRPAVVDGAGDVGRYTSLAVDSGGHLHVSYYDATNSILKYAYQDSAGWHFSTVDSAGDVGRGVSLALDAAGRPEMSYYDILRGELKYAYRDDTGWHPSTLDHTGTAGSYTSLAVDGAGWPHVSYRADDGLNYAYQDGTGWHFSVADSDRHTGKGSALALDGADYPHISYSGEGPYCGGGPHINCTSLNYAYLDATGWHTATLVALGLASNPSLALDAAGYPHIAFVSHSYDSWPSSTVYMYQDGAGWHSAIVTMGGRGAALALDDAGFPHLSYDGDGGLTYAYQDASGWHTTLVDSVGSLGLISLVVDAAGYGHISYTADGILKYAYHDAAGWHTETVDSSEGAGSYNSLAVDSTGCAHIGYYDTAKGDLKYARSACVAVEGVQVEGPARLPTGINGLFSATFTPPTATLPITVSWDNGTAGPAAAYSWTVTGTHTLHLTATNGCGTAQGAYSVTVFCQPPVGAAAAGPPALLAGQSGTYSAVPRPITASLPLTFTWDNGAVGPSAVYSWPATGTYTLTVTATNACGQGQGSLPVRVLAEWPYSRTLPVIFHDYVSGVCTPVAGVTVAGPGELLAGEAGLYRALYVPPGATAPLTVTWDNGQAGLTAAYSWTMPGQYTLTVTATNACSKVSATLSVSVTAGACRPVETAAITGPLVLPAGGTGLYTATYSPPSATLPLTLTWDNGATGAAASYSWTYPGVYTVTVTATNACGQVRALLTVAVVPPPAVGWRGKDLPLYIHPYPSIPDPEALGQPGRLRRIL